MWDVLERTSHEIAYIFGQLSSPFSIPSLLRVLRDGHEDEMVRHEAAEALGGIASEGEGDVDGGATTVSYERDEDRERGVLDILREWSGKVDAPDVVRESCQVAVDMWEVSSRKSHPAAASSFVSCQWADSLRHQNTSSHSTKTRISSNTLTS
jgi:hypothetical protein